MRFFLLINVQRVSSSSVEVNKSIVSHIKKGILCLICAVPNDTFQTCEKVAEKFCKLRIFNDPKGKMNKSLIDINGSVLLVSQFTLVANIKNGNRPDFKGAMEPIKAKLLFDHLAKLMMAKNIETKTGIFGANMKLNICNDGPVTIPMNIQ
tara:strand:+ start:307 stop:759 length:453 start_codon:yes stop_codon:yes gene_type:complete